MKLKDIPKDADLVGLKIKIPKKIQTKFGLPKKEMFIYSGWCKGLWLKATMEDGRIYPMTFETYKDLEEFEVICSPSKLLQMGS
jgi:hypothetical protein